MDTVTRAAILVDWDLLRAMPGAQAYIKAKTPHASIILLVSDPTHNDFDYDEFSDYEFDAVIRNSEKKPLPDFAFKKQALALVQNSANLIPVIGIDYDWFVLGHYEDSGLLYTLSELFFTPQKVIGS